MSAPHARGGGWSDGESRTGWSSSPGVADLDLQPTPPDPQLGICVVTASALLIVTTFLPWATVTPHFPDLGLLPGGPGDVFSGTRAYAGIRGLTGISVVIAALAAALLGGAGAVLGRRLAAFAIVPALTMLAALGLFAAEKGPEVVDAVYGDTLRRLPGLGRPMSGTMEISLGFGWWVSLGMAITLLGAATVSIGRIPDPWPSAGTMM